MKTLITGAVLGIVAKMLWDSRYGDPIRQRVNGMKNRAMNTVEDGIHRAEAAVETTATKVDNVLSSQ